MLPALDGPGNAADDFELTNDGWLFYGAVFTGQDLSGNPSQNEDSLFHYGSYGLHMGLGGAPNSQGTLPFSGVNVDPGGNQFLNVFSNYEDWAHGLNFTGRSARSVTSDQVVQSTVYRESRIEASDMGKTITFSFDARRPNNGLAVGDTQNDASGNVYSPATAQAFIRTIDPDAGYAATNDLVENMTVIGKGSWLTYVLELDLSDPALEGQIFQVGFENYSSNYDATAVSYDNVSISSIPIPATAWLFGTALIGLIGSRVL